MVKEIFKVNSPNKKLQVKEKIRFNNLIGNYDINEVKKIKKEKSNLLFSKNYINNFIKNVNNDVNMKFQHETYSKIGQLIEARTIETLVGARLIAENANRKTIMGKDVLLSDQLKFRYLF